MSKQLIHHITETAKIPSFSTIEERLHPYVRSVFDNISSKEIEVPGNSLIFQVGDKAGPTRLALAAHLDKINHYGEKYPSELPVEVTDTYIEGAMDDCAGLGIILALAENFAQKEEVNLLFFFSEMEESKGLKEHPERLRNKGEGYEHGMGAKLIAEQCIQNNSVPEEVITVDTTPLFKGKSGIALYSKHWELNELDPMPELIESTEKTVAQFIAVDPKIKLDNNTNDYLYYGQKFNKSSRRPTVSVALEPAIYPYHQKGERVYIKDVERTYSILTTYIDKYLLS